MNTACRHANSAAVVQDITDRKAAEEVLLLQALHDPLTGLPNRILFRERLEQVIRQRLDDTVAAVMVLDLDGFKAVNDEHGHGFGDVVLREVAARWRSALRRGETLARLGGDEFAVVAARIRSPEAAVRIGDRLIRRLNAPFDLNGHSLTLGVSVGIALHPQHGDDFDSLLTCADRAMYAAKRNGGGCAVFLKHTDH